MPKKLNITFGDITYSMSFLNRRIEAEVKEHFRLAEPSQKPDFSIIAGFQDNRSKYEGCEEIRFKGEKLFYNTAEKGEIKVFLPKKGYFPYAVYILAFFYNRFYQFGRLNGKRANGFLIHSAGLKRNGKGFLFTGPSGAGKSTISALSLPEAEILSDEMNVVFEDQGEYWISQGAIKTELSKAFCKMARLSVVFIIIQDKSNSLRKMSGTEIGLKLMENLIYVDLRPGLKWWMSL